MLRSSAPHVLLLAAATLASPVDSALAQTHFNDCVSMTGSSANVIVPASIEPTLNGSPLANGDEIAVFTTDGTCAGAATWTGGNLSLTVWGDDAVTTEKDGFQPGEELTFRLWDASADTEAVEVTVVYDASQPFYRTEGTYADNALYAPITFEASYDADFALPSAPTLAIPLNGAVGVNTTPTFIWSPIAQADTYKLQVATDQSFDTLWAEIENLTSTQYALLELPSGSVLYWRVRGENAAGEGEYSAAFSFSTVARQKGPNVAPSFTTSPLMQVTAGTPYLYDALTEDANEDAVVITALVLPSWLTFQADGPTATLTGTPVSGHVGSHEVTLRVEDPDGAWDEQAFTIVVKPSGLPNAAPVASAVIPDQALSLGTAKTIDLNDHFEDADLDPLAFDVDVDPAGIVDVRVTGSVLTLTPRRRGTAHLTVHAQDGAGGDATMEFDATVSGNRSPSAKPETRTLKEDTPLAIAVLDNDTDADGDPLTISIHTPPRNGTAEVTGNVILYTPASEYSGSDSFVYLISDGFGGTSSAVVYLEITQTNDAPTFATPDAITAPADGAEIEFTPQTIAAGASLTITWALATDAEKEAVQYQWQASLRADFSTYLTLVNLPPTGTYSRTLAQINAMLEAAFVPATGPVTLYHRILASDGRATTATDPRSIVFVRVDETATARETEQPGRFALGQNYPNPFNPQTTIDYELDRPGPATLTLVNMLGQEVAVLADGEHVAGRHSVVLNARDLPSGVYVYRLSAAGRVAARTAVLMK